MGVRAMGRWTLLGMMSLWLLGCHVQGASAPTNGADALSVKQDSASEGSCPRVPCPAGRACVEADGGARCVLAAPDAAAVACQVDSDCRLFADYCGGCACRALGHGEQHPVCKGAVVACFADPCRNLESHCEAGRCIARPPSG